MSGTTGGSGRLARRRFLQLGGGLAAAAWVTRNGSWAVAAGAEPLSGSRQVSAAKVVSSADRADAAYKAQQSYFYVSNGSSLYRETSPRSGNLYSYLWPFSQAMAATLDLYGISKASSREVLDRARTGLARYWDSGSTPPGYDSYPVRPYGGGGDKFYDDEAWVGLNLVRTYRMLGDTASLTQARKVFASLVSGWDSSATDPYPGGVYWTAASWNRDRNTVSTAPSAELGFRLYQLTSDGTYLDWATRMYNWVDTTLRDPADGLYWDHVTSTGVIETTKWSYNQGSMVGASVLAYQVTKTPDYLARAEAVASAALAYYGSIGYFGQDPAFNAIYFRNLLVLAGVTTNATLRNAITTAMQGYANTAWQINRSASNLFAFPAGSSPIRLIDQAALTQIYAGLAWPAATYDRLL
jgi:hypothetical protein